MATKDKIVNLEDLKVLSDHVEGEVTDLKSALEKTSNNLLDANNADVVELINSNGRTNPNANARSVVVPVTVTDQTKITVTKTVASSRFAIATFTSYPVAYGTSVNVQSNNSATSLTISVSSAIKYVMIYFWLASADSTIDPQAVLNGMMVEFGGTYTGYIPHIVPNIGETQARQIVTVANDAIYYADTYDSFSFVNGAFAGQNTPAFVSSTKRIRTKDLIYITPGEKVEIDPNGQKFAIGIWTKNNNTWEQIRNDNSFSTSPETISSTDAIYICIVVAKQDTDATITPSDLTAIVTVYKSASSNIGKIYSEVDEWKYRSRISRSQFRSIGESGNIVSHRGNPYPENTTYAVQHCIADGTKIIEIDIAFTSDNIPVLLHDETINRTGRNSDGSAISGTVNISDITYSDALQYDFGIWQGAEYAGQKLPKLQDVLLYGKWKRECFILDLTGHTYTSTQYEILHNLVQNCGMLCSCAMNMYSSQINAYTAMFTDTILNPSSSANSYDTLLSIFNQYKNVTPLIVASADITNMDSTDVEFFGKCEKLGVVTLVGFIDTVSGIEELFNVGCNLVYSNTIKQPQLE